MEHNRLALITGASRGLGLALARDLAEAGWALVIDAREPSALAAAGVELAARTPVRALAGDVADPAHRFALMAAVDDLAGPSGLDALVHNASVLGPSPRPRLADYPLDVLAHVYAVNVFAPLALTQLALPRLRPGARVVAVTSDAAAEAYEGWGGYGPYSTARWPAGAISLGTSSPPAGDHHGVGPGELRFLGVTDRRRGSSARREPAHGRPAGRPEHRPQRLHPTGVGAASR